MEKLKKKEKETPPLLVPQVEATEWCCGALRWLSVELALRLLAFTAATGPSPSDWSPQHCRTAMQMPGERRRGGGAAEGEGKAMMARGLGGKEDQLMCFCLCFLYLPSTSYDYVKSLQPEFVTAQDTALSQLEDVKRPIAAHLDALKKHNIKAFLLWLVNVPASFSAWWSMEVLAFWLFIWTDWSSGKISYITSICNTGYSHK